MLRRSVTAREFIAALVQDGFELQRARGSHHVYRAEGGRRVVVANHSPGQSFPFGTLKAMVDDAGWIAEDLQRLGLSR